MVKNILNIPANTKYWFVRAGSQAKYYQDFMLNNYIAIGDNVVSLEDLYCIDPLQTVTEKLFKNQYIEIYKKRLADKFIASNKYKELSADSRKAELVKISRSAGKSSTKGFNFVEKMKPGDIVLVPARNSSRFLIGLITTVPFDSAITHVYIDKDSEYSISKFEKKRRVFWLKEISLSELPDKLLWIKNGHQTIFDISKNADAINPLLSNQYTYKGQYYERIGVASAEKISEDDFFNLQSAVHETTKANSESKIYQTIDIQSPGEQILHTIVDNWDSIMTAVTIILGNVDINTPVGSVKFQGILPYFTEKFSKRAKLEKEIQIKKLETEKSTLQRKSEIDMDIQEEKLQQERIATKKAKLDLEAEEQKKLVESESIKESKKPSELTYINLTVDQRETLARIKANQTPIGNVVSPEMQMDSVIEVVGEHSQEAKQKSEEQ